MRPSKVTSHTAHTFVRRNCQLSDRRRHGRAPNMKISSVGASVNTKIQNFPPAYTVRRHQYRPFGMRGPPQYLSHAVPPAHAQPVRFTLSDVEVDVNKNNCAGGTQTTQCYTVPGIRHVDTQCFPSGLEFISRQYSSVQRRLFV